MRGGWNHPTYLASDFGPAIDSRLPVILTWRPRQGVGHARRAPLDFLVISFRHVVFPGAGQPTSRTRLRPIHLKAVSTRW